MANPIASWPFTFAPFGFITGATPNVPEFYWNVVSDEQRWKFLCVNLASLVDYANELGVQIGVSAQDIADLQKAMQDLKDSGLLDYYEKQIYDWIQAHMADLLSAGIKQVYFGLTDDTYSGGAGYFVAYIPESWSEIVFDTGAVYGLDTYGRLILRWDADSPYTVEQKPEYNDIELSALIAEIKTTANDAMSLAKTNEKGISTNDGEIAALDTRITALEKA